MVSEIIEVIVYTAAFLALGAIGIGPLQRRNRG